MAKILLATSRAGVQQLYQRALVPDGHTFVMCADGGAVRSVLMQESPDLVIADADLPDMDAFDLVQTLQQVASTRPMPPLIIRPPADAFSPPKERTPREAEEDLRSLVRARLAAARAGRVRARIMVVDDDQSLRKSLQVSLEREGHAVITAINGEDALAQMESDSPDLVLTDVDMPVMDGLSLLQAVRSRTPGDILPVIVMTAHAVGADQAARGLDLGANDYIRKPFDWRELHARVQSQLRVREHSRLTAEKQRDLAVIELAGAAAHEINNPLSVIMARLELIREDAPPGSPLARGLDQIDHLVERIAAVVQKMTHVRRYQVQNYCAGVNILDLEAASKEDR